jgi:hypothetical protein
MRGKDAIRAFFAGVFQALPQAQWTADSRLSSVSDGVDTFCSIIQEIPLIELMGFL